MELYGKHVTSRMVLTSVFLGLFSWLAAQDTHSTGQHAGEAACTHGWQCVSPEQSKVNAEMLFAKRDALVKTKAFKEFAAAENAKRSSQTHVYFAWPMHAVSKYDHIPHYYTIEFYVDHSDGNTGLQDYQCNERTYDEHRGTDINIWPFFWHMKANAYVQALAAAPGMVAGVNTGNNNDDNCSGCVDGEDNNYVSIVHADSSMSIYYHLKDNSALVIDEQIVYEGQPIAYIGSSGCSYNPHLHFEVYDADDHLIDPFSGSCNDLNDDSWWQDEKPYWEPRINRLMTHSAQPALHGYNGSNQWCASGEDVNGKNQFNPGETVWFGTAIYSPQPDDEIDFYVYEPDGDLLWTETYTYGGNDPAVKRYYAFGRVLPANAPSGTYRFRAFYRNVVYNHWFTVSCTDHYTLSGGLPFHHGYIASNYINNSGQTSGGGRTAYYQSAGHLLFLPGFHAGGGVSLEGRIRSCAQTD